MSLNAFSLVLVNIQTLLDLTDLNILDLDLINVISSMLFYVQIQMSTGIYGTKNIY